MLTLTAAVSQLSHTCPAFAALLPMFVPKQVVCVDAALRLQEAWVAAAVRGFALRESDLPRRLSAEDAAARALVVPGHAAWEAGLPQAVDEVIVASTTFEDASAKQQLGASSGVCTQSPDSSSRGGGP